MKVTLSLPRRRSPILRIIADLEDCGVRFISDLAQEEYGPTRAERAAGLSDVVDSLEQVHSAVEALSASARECLREALANFPRAESRTPGDPLEEYEAEKGAIESLSLAAADVPQFLGPCEYASVSEAVFRLEGLSNRARTQLLGLDTTSDFDVLFGPALSTSKAHGQNDDLSMVAEALRRLIARLRAELERLSLLKGPDPRVSLPTLVARLCDLWERETGSDVTVNPYVKTEYDRAPTSEAGA